MTINIPEGMVAWNGGDRAPADWDGGPQMRADGKIAYWANWSHETVDPDYRIIAYTSGGLREKVKPDHAKSLMFGYTNYRGEAAVRTAIPERIYWGATEYHPEPQWLLEAWDSEKEAIRIFALGDCVFDRAQIIAPKPTPYPAIGREEMIEAVATKLARSQGLNAALAGGTRLMPWRRDAATAVDCILALIQTKGEGKG